MSKPGVRQYHEKKMAIFQTSSFCASWQNCPGAEFVVFQVQKENVLSCVHFLQISLKFSVTVMQCTAKKCTNARAEPLYCVLLSRPLGVAQRVALCVVRRPKIGIVY